MARAHAAGVLGASERLTQPRHCIINSPIFKNIEKNFSMYFRIVSSLPWKLQPLTEYGKRRCPVRLFPAAPHKKRSIVISDENPQLLKNQHQCQPSQLLIPTLPLRDGSYHFLALSKSQSSCIHSLAVPDGRECSPIRIGHGNYNVKLHNLPSERCVEKYSSYFS